MPGALVRACVLLLCLAAASPARAQTVRGDFYITNGTVNAEVLSGTTLYVGGSFTSVGPMTGSGAPLDATTALVVAGFPRVVGDLNAVVADGTGGWYIGGSFTSVGGQVRANLAHILSDNSVAAWNPGANAVVRCLALGGTTLYAGGDFTSAGGQARNRIVGLDAATGAATTWNPNASGTVSVLALSGGTIYAGGSFTNIGGQARNRIAALNGTSGLATGWNPNSASTVLAIVPNGLTVYVGGQFTTIGGGTRNRIAEVDAVSGLATGWNPNANGTVSVLALSGGTIYAGGSFTTVGGQTRNRIAALDGSSGLATAWNANADNQVLALALAGATLYAGGDFLAVGGAARSRIAALDLTSGLATGWNPSAYGTVSALALGPGTVYAGGAFDGIGGVMRNNLAAFDVVTGAATPWNPGVNNQVLALALDGSTLIAGGTFTSAGGQTRNNIAAVDVATGLATAWNPNANGEVAALALHGGTIYVGGAFGNVGGQARGNLAELDLTTGLATAWNPGTNGEVFAIEPAPGVVYAGGIFSSAGGQARSSIAALDTATGLATAWNPNSNGTVRALQWSCSRVYVAGFFNTIGGQARNRVAAIDASSGLATGWNPDANSALFALALRDGRVIVGGIFTLIGGQLRDRIASLDPVTGLATAWNPGANGTIRTVAVGGGAVYAGGGFTRLGGLQLSNLAAIGADASFSCPVVTVTPGDVPVGVVAIPYAQTLVASGGTAPYCYAVTSGALPAGLTLSAATGSISGTPTATGTSVFTVTATDANGCTGSEVYVMGVFATPPGSTVTASTAGLCISPAHPCVSVPVVFTRDESGPARGISVSVQLETTKLALCTPGNPAASIHPGTWLSGYVNTAFQVVDHGGGSYTVDQTLLGSPCGVTVGGELFRLDVASAGPDGQGAITVTAVKARDCDGAIMPAVPGAPALLTVLNTPIPIIPASLNPGIVDVAYTQALSAGAGAAPFVWAVTAGTLPPGLTLSPAGEIAGTPTTTSNSVLTISVTDANDCTGSVGYVLSVFATPPGSNVMANTAGLCLSPAHPCVSVPVIYTRDESAPARGISVTVQLDATKLALCTPGTPTASIHLGTWLSAYGNTTFQVVDHGGGSYTVDQALLGVPCGVTTGGELFRMDLAAVDPGGEGSITVTYVKARDCGGGVIPAVPGPATLLAIPTVPPAVITDLASAQVLSGNGAGGTTGITVTWTTGGAGTVALYRAPFGTYPEYDDAGPTFPPDSGLAPGPPWTLASAAATSGYVDHPPVRGFWYYVALVTDSCGLVSSVSNMTAGSLDYHLGDVSNGFVAGQGDNLVRGVDISLLGANYGIGEPDITSRGVAYLDVGPTTDLLATSRPITDDQLDFEDLILFALNYDQGSAVNVAARPGYPAAARVVSAPGLVSNAAGAGLGPEEFRVVAAALVEAGETVGAEVWLRGGGRVQGFSAHLSWDATVVEPVGAREGGMESGQWVEGQGGVVLSPGPGVVDAALLGARAQGMVGEGRVAVVRFRALRTGGSGIGLKEVVARDGTNHGLGEGEVVARAEAVRPERTLLLSPRPNPVRGGERAELAFSLAARGMVELAIYGVDGRRVRTVVREEREAGVYREGWDGRDEGGRVVGTGVYYAHLAAGGARFTQAVLRIR